MAATIGNNFCALLTERGGLMLFGTNRNGQLGLGHADNYANPVLLGGVGLARDAGDAGDAGDAVHAGNAGHAGHAKDAGHAGDGQGLDGLPGNMDFMATVAEVMGPRGIGPPEQMGPGEHPFQDEALIMVAAGRSHTVCVTEGGAVYVSGANGSGQLGLGHRSSRNRFSAIGADVFGQGARATMVACGYMHTLVLTQTGEVWAFGMGRAGQTGNVLLQDRLDPALVGGLSRIVMVAAGRLQSAAVGADGRLWTWGASHYGALGHDDTDSIARPAPRALGPHAFGGEAVVFVAVGTECMAVVTAAGDLWAWGKGIYYQLGLGDDLNRRVPTQVTDAGPPPAWGGSRVRMVSCGRSHADGGMAVTEAGVVWTWGTSSRGALGHGREQQRRTPARIPQLPFHGARIVLVCKGENHVSMAVSEHGVVYMWGKLDDHHEISDVPRMLAASVYAGARCGRSGGLSREQLVVFAQGTHARLGAGCACLDLPDETIICIAKQGQILTAPYGDMHEGLLRLLAVSVRKT